MIKDCEMKKHPYDLPFDFIDGSCSTFSAAHPWDRHAIKLYLCFGSNEVMIDGSGDLVPMENICFYINGSEVWPRE